jgi:hypothetical protein
MFSVFNVIVILLVLLIAYWWANQGLFSAMLHLLCVIAAGAIALGLWEPLTVGLLLRGSAFDNYAWGVSLILVFALSLFGIRLAMDKLVGSNVDLPHWANLAFGFPLGAAAGILTMGIFMIGAGHIQSGKDIMGFRGYARSSQTGRVESVNKLWLPIHAWTSDFYGLLSVTSLGTSQPLRHYNPDVHYQSTLLRDSSYDGKGKFSLRPRDARVEKVEWCADQSRFAVTVVFEAGARDFGEQLTLSNAQVRLIAAPRGSFEAKYVFPDVWSQYDGWHRFDSITHYVTSEPAQSQSRVVFEFDARDLAGQPAKFIQIRGTRFALPNSQATCEFTANRSETSALAVVTTTTIDTGQPSIQSAFEISNSIRPIMASVNAKPSQIELTKDRHISGGEGEFSLSGERASSKLMIQGIQEPHGTRVVQLDVSRESPANIFGTVMQAAAPNAPLLLVDEQGRTYMPIGYMHTKANNKTTIKVEYQHYVRTINLLPVLPTAGGETLKLLFNVTEGKTIIGFKVGDVTVGTSALYVTPKEGKAPATDGSEAPKTPTAGGGLPG